VSIDAETGDGWRPTRGRGGEGGWRHSSIIGLLRAC
jgi:hypothetical protein